MATYIVLINYTDQGIRNIKDSPRRADAARQALSDMGGEMKELYMTMGGYDLVVVAEAPSDDDMAKFALTWSFPPGFHSTPSSSCWWRRLRTAGSPRRTCCRSTSRHSSAKPRRPWAEASRQAAAPLDRAWQTFPNRAAV